MKLAKRSEMGQRKDKEEYKKKRVGNGRDMAV